MEPEKKNQKDVMWSNIFSKLGLSITHSKFEILKKIPTFSDLSLKELKVVGDICYERTYQAGEYMFQINQPGAAMFIIEEGAVEIIRSDEKGEDITLAELGSGEFLGELALLDNAPRSASALVVKPTKALAIFREDLENLLNTRPQLGGKIMKKLAVIVGIRLRATNDLLMKEKIDPKTSDKNE
jgi:CRP-like cAMP-binding protein